MREEVKSLERLCSQQERSNLRNWATSRIDAPCSILFLMPIQATLYLVMLSSAASIVAAGQTNTLLNETECSVATIRQLRSAGSCRMVGEEEVIQKPASGKSIDRETSRS